MLALMILSPCLMRLGLFLFYKKRIRKLRLFNVTSVIPPQQLWSCNIQELKHSRIPDHHPALS